MQVFLDELFQNAFSTVAFQVAVIAGFLGEIEYADKAKKASGQKAIDRETEFDVLIACLNKFFVPKTSSQFVKLVSVFAGDLAGDIVDWKLTKTPHTFREVVFWGEMQPDQWPKYRVILLELWRPTDHELGKRVEEQRNLCRGQIFNSLFERLKTEFLTRELKREEDLSAEDIKKLYEDTRKAIVAFLGGLGWAQKELPSLADIKSLATPTVGGADGSAISMSDQWATQANES